MKTTITAEISKDADPKKEVAGLRLHFDGKSTDLTASVNGASLVKVSRTTPNLAQDLLTIASCVYAADESVKRIDQEDKWSREIAIEIPVRNFDNWNGVARRLSECLSFLTGDQWELSFRAGTDSLIRPRILKRRIRTTPLRGEAVCLFSGGLDSLIGAIDWLTANKNEPLLLVGHYDQGVSGPGKDQRDLAKMCVSHFGSRFRLVQTQVGAVGDRGETSFRSRSFLFLALAAYSAELLGPGTPILIPENGPIALNFPLMPARRGSCSTRTVHPFFIREINSILAEAGIRNPISNPYEFKTKGDMVAECLDQQFLEQTYALSRSCAKANRRQSWSDRSARGCGTCVPCLFRRASLHATGRDDEAYGKRVENFTRREDLPDDVLALGAFVRRNDSDFEIAAGLLANGSLPISLLNDYIEVVKGMRSEVRDWIKAKGPQFLNNLIGP
jgi:7-cyano-7-deazaguanine synthase in queuosine biosynthesis